MSEQAKAPLTDEQRRGVVVHMFKKTHEDMAVAIKLLMANPTPTGFMVQTEAAGEITVRMTRAMGALEKLIEMNTPKSDTPGASGEAAYATSTSSVAIGGVRPMPTGLAKDGAILGGTWATTPAPPDDGKPVMTAAAQAEAQAKLVVGDTKAELTGHIANMTVGVIEQVTARQGTDAS